MHARWVSTAAGIISLASSLWRRAALQSTYLAMNALKGPNNETQPLMSTPAGASLWRIPTAAVDLTGSTPARPFGAGWLHCVP